MRWLVLAVCMLAACRTRPRTPCEETCALEARCADELELPADDVTACATRCAALERDPQAQPLVAEHLRCVRNAPSCKAMLECQ